MNKFAVLLCVTIQILVATGVVAAVGVGCRDFYSFVKVSAK
jgi:hypothetical protein